MTPTEQSVDPAAAEAVPAEAEGSVTDIDNLSDDQLKKVLDSMVDAAKQIIVDQKVEENAITSGSTNNPNLAAAETAFGVFKAIKEKSNGIPTGIVVPLGMEIMQLVLDIYTAAGVKDYANKPKDVQKVAGMMVRKLLVEYGEDPANVAQVLQEIHGEGMDREVQAAAQLKQQLAGEQ